MSAVMQFFAAWFRLNPEKSIVWPQTRRPTAPSTYESRRSSSPRLSQPPPFSFRIFGGTPDARAISTLFTTGGIRRQEKAQTLRLRKKDTFTYGNSLALLERDFSKAVLRKERTFRDREPVGQMLPKFAK
jgi:hypothetical protein